MGTHASGALIAHLCVLSRPGCVVVFAELSNALERQVGIRYLLHVGALESLLRDFGEEGPL